MKCILNFAKQLRFTILLLPIFLLSGCGHLFTWLCYPIGSGCPTPVNFETSISAGLRELREMHFETMNSYLKSKECIFALQGDETQAKAMAEILKQLEESKGVDTYLFDNLIEESQEIEIDFSKEIVLKGEDYDKYLKELKESLLALLICTQRQGCLNLNMIELIEKEQDSLMKTLMMAQLASSSNIYSTIAAPYFLTRAFIYLNCADIEQEEKLDLVIRETEEIDKKLNAIQEGIDD